MTKTLKSFTLDSVISILTFLLSHSLVIRLNTFDNVILSTFILPTIGIIISPNGDTSKRSLLIPLALYQK